MATDPKTGRNDDGTWHGPTVFSNLTGLDKEEIEAMMIAGKKAKEAGADKAGIKAAISEASRQYLAAKKRMEGR